MGPHGTSSGKFLIAPSARVIGGSIFGVVMLDPWLRRNVKNIRWLLIWLAAAALIANGYLLLNYLPIHRAGWIARSQAPTSTHVSVVLFIMLMSGAFAASLAGIISRPSSTRLVLFITGVACALVAGSAAYWGAKWRVAASEMIASDVPTLITVQALVPLATWGCILMTDEISSRLAAIKAPRKQ